MELEHEKFNHDMTDPEADAEARELTFARSTARYVGHHVRNTIQADMSMPERAQRRLLAMADAMDKRIREDGGE